MDGVNAHDGVYRATLTGLNCRGNGRSGISIGGASRVMVESCLVGNNGAAQVRTEGACHARLIGCDLLDNSLARVPVDANAIMVRVCDERPPGREDRHCFLNGGLKVFVADSPQFERQFVRLSEGRHRPRGDLEPAVVVA